MSSTHPSLASRTDRPRRLRVVGGGMVAHRLVEALRDRDVDGTWVVDLYCEEPRAPYDRVALTSYFSGRDPESLSLGSPDLWDDPCVTLVRGRAATTLDLAARTVRSDDGTVRRYDRLVLATGSRPTVPPIVEVNITPPAVDTAPAMIGCGSR